MIGGIHTAGQITETEAYAVNDKACHCYAYKRTRRTEPMYLAGGHSYVYLCYGVHHLFNVVTNIAGTPEAVLIRSIKPLIGKETMLERRKMLLTSPKLSTGPGNMSQAMGITAILSGLSLCEDIIWIESVQNGDLSISSSPRIGVGYAEEDALRPWRFFLTDTQWISKPH